MNDVFEIPPELQHKISSVSDNREQNQTIKIDAKKFVQIFRPDLEEWLTKLALEKQQNP